MVNDDKIRFLELVTPQEELKEELSEVFATALKTGPIVEGFEHEFAAFCEAEYCVGVASGIDAVRFALMAASVPKESIVVTGPDTFIATTEAISQAGAHPEFVDIDERTYNMDPEKLRLYLVARLGVSQAVTAGSGLR
jgi:dTDP-4-amino-4,6-dideoxygalactose transaminase